MHQTSNIIRLEEGGVSTPYIVLERFSALASPKVSDGKRLVRETRGNEVALLLCEPISDAEWIDIPTDGQS